MHMQINNILRIIQHKLGLDLLPQMQTKTPNWWMEVGDLTCGNSSTLLPEGRFLVRKREEGTA